MARKPTGMPNGRPPGSGTKAAKPSEQGIALASRRKMALGQNEFEVYKIYPDTGTKMFLGLTDAKTPEAVGANYGGGQFEIIERRRTDKQVVGQPIPMSLHPAKWPEKYPSQFNTQGQLPSQMLHGFQVMLPPGSPYPGNPYPGQQPYPGPYPAMPPAAMDDDGDDFDPEEERKRIREEIRRDQETESLRRQLAELSLKLSAPPAQPLADPMAQMRAMLEVVGHLKQMEAPQPQIQPVATVSKTEEMMAMMKMVFDLSKTLANKPAPETDSSEGLLNMLVQAFPSFMEAAKNAPPAPAPAPAASPEIVDVKATVEPPPAAPAQSQEDAVFMDWQKAAAQLFEGIKAGQLQKAPVENVALWVNDQNGPGWETVKGFIKGNDPDFLLGIAKTNAPETADAPEKIRYIEELALLLKA